MLGVADLEDRGGPQKNHRLGECDFGDVAEKGWAWINVKE